jgi:hypothetical protein
MLRPLAVATILLAYLIVPAGSQSPAPVAAPAAPSPGKPVAKKPAPKAKAAAKLAAAVNSGPCRLGVIPVIGEHFSVQKFGVTIFEVEFADVPIDWGLDDLAFARVRAITGVDPTIRKITYPKGAFDPFYHPKSTLLPNPDEGLSAIVHGITLNAHCERYLVITTFQGKLGGNSNQLLVGIGAYNQGLGSIIRHSHLFANIELTLIDGKTYEKDRRPFANFGAHFAESLRMTEDPLVKLDNSQFPDPPATASSSTVLRERIGALVATRLDAALPGYLKEE